MTLIFIDTETTGLDKGRNSIVQLAGIIKSNGIEEKFDFRMAPYHGEEMSPIATEKTGLTTDEVYSYPDQKSVFEAFTALLKKYITSYSTKGYMIGYNAEFDYEFIRSWFEFNNANWGYYVWFPYIDTMTLAGLYTVGKRPHMRSFKLTEVYKTIMGKPFENAHDAFADIYATKELFEKLTMDFVLRPKPFLRLEDNEENDEIPF